MADRYGLEIRGLVEADGGGVSELLAGCGVVADARRCAERIAQLRSRPGAALAAHAWGPPSGVVVAHWAHGLLADAPAAHLDLIAVAADERRRGVGRLLLKAAAQAARQAGCTELRLEVGAAGAGLLAFARASGFEPLATGLVRPLRRRG